MDKTFVKFQGTVFSSIFLIFESLNMSFEADLTLVAYLKVAL